MRRRRGADAPERLALGATTGRLTARSRSSARGWLGTRNAMLESPAEASSETGQPAARRTTTVKGPGQNARTSFFASAENVPNAKPASAE